MANTEELKYIQVNKIIANRNQPRTNFDQKALGELADSIDQEGLIQPIIVRKVDDVEGAEYEIIAGERRWRAHKMLEKPRIQAIVRTVEQEKSATQALIENIQRENLNPIEEAKAIFAMQREQGLNQEQCAVKLGKSRAHISNMLRLLKLPESVQTLLNEEKLNMWQGVVMLTAPKDKVEKLAEDTVKNGWPVETLRKKVSAMTGSEDGKPKMGRPKKQVDPSFQLLVDCESQEELDQLKQELEEAKYVVISGTKLNTHLKKLAAAIAEEKQDKGEEGKTSGRRPLKRAAG